MVVVDTETTGLVAGYHEIISIALIKLKPDYKMEQSIPPFYIYIIPEHEDRIDPEALRVNKLDLETVMAKGFKKEKAIELMINWFDNLNCGPLIALAQNWPFDKAFILEMMGFDLFTHMFHRHYRDTSTVANYINDRAYYFSQPKPFENMRLKTLSKYFKIDYSGAHDAFKDCLITADVYKHLINFDFQRM